MKAALLVFICANLTLCSVTMPLGEDGRYGEIFVGYRLPDVERRWDVLNQSTLRDK